jgi:O-glycosyl hydrolase
VNEAVSYQAGYLTYVTSSSKNAEQGTAITLSNNSFVYAIPPYSVVTFVEL